MKTIANKHAVIAFSMLVVAGFGFCETPQDILKRVDKVMRPESGYDYKTLINIEPDGNKKEFTMFTLRSGDKVAMIFLSPTSDKGRAILRLGTDMWVYLPSVGKPIRQATQDSITGSIFNNQDLLSLDFSTEYDPALAGETDSQIRLDLKAKTNAIAYDHLKMWISKKMYTIDKIECYSASDLLIKTIDFKDIKNFGNKLIRPAVMETTSPLHKGYKSVVIYTEIRNKNYKNEIFTLNYFHKIGELR